MSACLAVRDHDKLDLKSKETNLNQCLCVTRGGGGGGGGDVLPSSGLLGVCHLIEVEFLGDLKT